MIRALALGLSLALVSVIAARAETRIWILVGDAAEPNTVERIRAHFEAMGDGTRFSFELHPIPFKRLDETLTQIPFYACAIPIGRATAEKVGLKWIDLGQTMTMAFYARPGLDIPVRQLSDVKGFRIGVTVGSPAAAVAADAGLDVDAVRTSEQNLRKLDAGRIDFWLIDEQVVPLIAEKSELPMPRLAFRLTPREVGIACRPEMRGEDIAQVGKIVRAYLAKYGTRFYTDDPPRAQR